MQKETVMKVCSNWQLGCAVWQLRVLALANEVSKVPLDTVMRDVFVKDINHSTILDGLFEEDATKDDANFAKVVTIAEAKESAIRQHSSKISSEVKSAPAEVHYGCAKSYPGKRYEKGKDSSSINNRNTSNNDETRGGGTPRAAFVASVKCCVCDRKNHKSSEWRYKNYKCHKSCKIGHFAPMCGFSGRKMRQSFLQEEQEESRCTETNVHESIFSIHHAYSEGSIGIDSGGNVKPIYLI